ncbi:MAG: phenylalanine--tRNA ligase subunit beta, partial [Archangium sp.]|nr:phenylalanine--tRNA ligase subunit beta [Archangium sp.]
SALEPERTEARIERTLRIAMAGQGLSEVLNYSFVSMRELEAFEATAQAIQVSNPLSAEQSVMRTTLLPGLVQNVVRAARHQTTGVRLYELARSYRQSPNGGREGRPVAEERLELAGALWGLRSGTRGWAAKDEPVDFYDAKGAVEAVLRALHIEGATFGPLESPWFHPRASASVSVKGDTLGTIGALHPRVVKRLDAPAGVLMFQLDVAKLQQLAKLVPQAAPLPKYPAVLRDLAVVVPTEMPSDAVREVILDVGKPLVTRVEVFDVYAGPQVGEGKKNVAFALAYSAADRTLTDVEVAAAHQRIVAEVTQRLGGVLRT